MQPRLQFQPLSVLYFSGLFLALAGLLGFHAFVSPAAQFLRPATEGQWIVHPNINTGEPRLEYVLKFDLEDAPPSALPVRVTAMRSFEVLVNGRPVAKAAPENWKTATAVDLAAGLRSGANEVRIRVYNRSSPPALLVEGPDLVRSDGRWATELPGQPEVTAPVVVAEQGEKNLEPKPNFLATSPHANWWTGAFAAYVALLAFTLIPRGTPKPASPGRTRLAGAAAGAVFALVAAVQFRNTTVYPLSRGFDPVQHAEYVQYMAEHWRVPYADEGWEFSQPPLYYALGAVLYEQMGGKAAEPASLRAVQLLSPVTAMATLALAWWMLAILFPGRARPRLLGFVAATVMPVSFYLGAQVSNEFFAAFTIGAATCLATRQVQRATLRWADALLLGLACGLGLLSKYTGLFVFLAVLSAAGLRTLAGSPTKADGEGKGQPVIETRPLRRRFHHLSWTTLLAALTVAIAGWLYARNIEKFGTAFIGAWDERSGFRIVQPPGYHTLDYYLRFGSVFWQEIQRAPFASFWDGMYGSLWGDTYWMFLSRDSAEITMLATACLWLGLLPTVAIALGFGQALWRLLTRGWNHPFFVPVVTTALTATAMTSFTVEHPFYSVQKAHWGLSLLPCAAAFAGLGLDTMCRRLGPLRWLVYLDLAALTALVPYLFWYRGPA